MNEPKPGVAEPRNLVIEPDDSTAPAHVDPTGSVNPSGFLCYARVKVLGTQIAGVMGLCEPRNAEGDECSRDLEDEVLADGVEFMPIGNDEWEAYYIPDAHCCSENKKWNCLHVYYGTYGSMGITWSPLGAKKFSVLPANCGPCGGGPGGGLVQVYGNGNYAPKDSESNSVIVEPSVQDGDWWLYRNLPVNAPFGVILGLHGRPLRASSISVAVEDLSIRRVCYPPFLQLATPFGTGEAATDQLPVRFRFPGYSSFGSIIYQPPRCRRDDLCQLIHSVSRDAPMTILTHADRTIRFVINSPKAADFANEGFADLWLRINAR